MSVCRLRGGRWYGGRLCWEFEYIYKHIFKYTLSLVKTFIGLLHDRREYIYGIQNGTVIISSDPIYGAVLVFVIYAYVCSIILLLPMRMNSHPNNFFNGNTIRRPIW